MSVAWFGGVERSHRPLPKFGHNPLACSANTCSGSDLRVGNAASGENSLEGFMNSFRSGLLMPKTGDLQETELTE
jgi:hypothetical protein